MFGVCFVYILYVFNMCIFWLCMFSIFLAVQYMFCVENLMLYACLAQDPFISPFCLRGKKKWNRRVFESILNFTGISFRYKTNKKRVKWKILSKRTFSKFGIQGLGGHHVWDSGTSQKCVETGFALTPFLTNSVYSSSKHIQQSTIFLIFNH